jgi:hypothetical protein
VAASAFLGAHQTQRCIDSGLAAAVAGGKRRGEEVREVRAQGTRRPGYDLKMISKPKN